MLTTDRTDAEAAERGEASEPDLPLPEPGEHISLWTGSAKARIGHVDRYCRSRRDSRIDYQTLNSHPNIERLCARCLLADDVDPKVVARVAVSTLERFDGTLKFASESMTVGRAGDAATYRAEAAGLLDQLAPLAAHLGPYRAAFALAVDTARVRLRRAEDDARLSGDQRDEVIAAAAAAYATEAATTAGAALDALDVGRVARAAFAGRAERTGPADPDPSDAFVAAVLTAVITHCDTTPAAGVHLSNLHFATTATPDPAETVAAFARRCWRDEADTAARAAAREWAERFAAARAETGDVTVWVWDVTRRSEGIRRALRAFVAAPGPDVVTTAGVAQTTIVTVPGAVARLLCMPNGVGCVVDDGDDLAALAAAARTVSRGEHLTAELATLRRVLRHRR